MADGHLNRCKECTKKDVRKNRSENLSYYQEYDRFRYDQSDERKQSCWNQAEKASRNGSATERNRRYRAKYPLRVSANNAVSNSIRDGIITRQPCVVCGSTENVEAHHKDYSKPLDVTWLCTLHHADTRRKERAPGFVPKRKQT